MILRNDTFAVSRAGTTSSWGIGVVCGTGVNCAAVGPDGRTVRFPALAELSGDFAPGGSWLGVRALGLALRAGDGRGGPTSLRERVPAHLGQPDAEAVLSGIYTGAIPYARLFEWLGAPRRGRRRRPARPPDGQHPGRRSRGIRRGAVVRLDLQDEPVEVVLGGGVFHTSDVAFHGQRRGRRPRRGASAVLVRLDAPPVLGAALIGLDAIGAPASALAAVRERLTSPSSAATP